MSTCTIIIKIKDYFPKIDSIPYQNYICLFTNGESEGQIPLVSQENECYQHQIKNIVSDIKYKVHVLDFNDMSLIGMCDMAIPYNIISQINPPNGFIQEQQKKLLMDGNTKRKLFGTVLNMGDIYLNIYSEIYLSEKNNTSIVSQNNRSTRKKKLISVNNNSKLKKKIDGSPRTVHKKKLIMEMNSDRQAMMNLNKHNFLNVINIEKPKNFTSNNKDDKSPIPAKKNSSFNYKDIQPKEEKNGFVKINNNIKKKNLSKKRKTDNAIAKKQIDKKYNIEKEKENYNLSHNLLNRYKTESNKTPINNNSKLRKKKNLQNKINDINNNEKILKGGVNYFSNPQNKNLLMDNISPKMSNNNYNENEEIQFTNKSGNKITTIESLENIDFSGKKYITKSKTKKSNSPNNLANVNNTLFSTNSTEQEINDIDKIIVEKGNEITNDFNIQLKNKNYTNENIIGNDNNLDYVEQAQLEIKNNIIKLIDFYSLLSHKILKLNQKNINLDKKSFIYKEKLFTELKKNNVLTQKKTNAEIENFINVNNHGALNEKFLRAMIKLKKSEFKIYQNIFNLFYYEYDILKFKEFEKNKKMEENVKIELLLVVFRNLIKNYGNISQIHMGNTSKKNILKNCLNKYGLIEKNEGEGNNNNIEMMQNNIKDNLKENNINNLENKDNANEIDKFKVIKEEDEEKEDELDEEEDKINNIQNNNIISFNNSNTKENINMLNSNEKLKSNNKSNKGKSGQKRLFANEDNSNKNLNNKKDLDINKDDNKDNLGNQNKRAAHKNNIIDDIQNLMNFNKNYEEINDIPENKPENKDKKIDNNFKKEDKFIKNENNNINEMKEQEKKYTPHKNSNKKEEKEKLDIIKDNIENKENIDKNNKINNIKKDIQISDEIIREDKNEKEKNKKLEKEEEKEVLNINNDYIEKKIKNDNEMSQKKEPIKEIITNTLDSERDEIKSIRNEINPSNDYYSKKDRFNENKKAENGINIENSTQEIKEEKKEIQNNNKEESNYRSREVYRRKNRIRKREEKDIYDEEDLKMQKLLTEEFPKKCKDENKFVRISKYEYSFGDEKIKVAYENGEVILKLDEGDYKLTEFIEILNEGKQEDEEEYETEQKKENKNFKKNAIYEEKEEMELEKEIEEETPKKRNYSDKKSSNKKSQSESNEKKGTRKRRRKRVSMDSQEEEEKEDNSENDMNNDNNYDNEKKIIKNEEEKNNYSGKKSNNDNEKEIIKNEDEKNNYSGKKNYYSGKRGYYLEKKEMRNRNNNIEKNEEKENVENEVKNEENDSGKKYVMRRRKDYLNKKVNS